MASIIGTASTNDSQGARSGASQQRFAYVGTPIPQAIATTLCEDGVCSEGFGIDYVRTGYGCRTRPVVRELSEAVLSLFARSARHS